MSKRTRLRAIVSVLAVSAASLALVATAGAKGGGEGVVIQSRDACDPATFPVPCNRTDNSGGVVAFDDLLATVAAEHSHPAWKFTKDHLTVKRGTPVVAEFGRGGEVHTFTDVTATGPGGPGCVAVLNNLIFGSPDLAPMCGALDPATGAGVNLGKIIFGSPEDNIPASGLLPGQPLTIDTSTPGTRFFQCMIHPWMRTTLTVE
jgi:hypothetical protein